MKERFNLILLQILPIVILILGWELFVRLDNQLIFYFGQPTKIFKYIVNKSLDGTLLNDFLITLIETIAGFILGNILGVAIGLSLWFSNKVFQISRPYIIALGSAPIFSLAPLMIIWFGTGLYSKVMISFLSTVFIALLQAYTGASEVDQNYIKLMKTLNATRMQIFRKVIAPSSVTWVISAFKINVGFALLGAFIGEYISSTAGLGHLILIASGLFDISLVLTGVLLLICIALILNYAVDKIESPLKRAIVELL